MTRRYIFCYLIHEMFVLQIMTSLLLMIAWHICSCDSMIDLISGYYMNKWELLKLEQYMRTEKTPKPQFSDMNTAGLHSNASRSKSKTFKNLSELRTLTVSTRILPSLLQQMQLVFFWILAVWNRDHSRAWVNREIFQFAFE